MLANLLLFIVQFVVRKSEISKIFLSVIDQKVSTDTDYYIHVKSLQERRPLNNISIIVRQLPIVSHAIKKNATDNRP